MSAGLPPVSHLRLFASVLDRAPCRFNKFGIGLEPCSKAIIGSQNVPYIYEDRPSKEDFLDGLTKLYEMTKEERDEMAIKWQESALIQPRAFSFRLRFNTFFRFVVIINC